MTKSQSHSERRYEGIRKQKDAERNDETHLTFQMRLLRRTIEKSRFLDTRFWNSETMDINGPLWFDAAVTINLGQGRREFGLIDLEQNYLDPRNLLLKKRKQAYADEFQIPYLRVKPHRMEVDIFVWALSVRKELAVSFRLGSTERKR